MPSFSVSASSASVVPPLLALLDEGGELRVALRGVRGQRMLGRDGAEGDAHDRVGARREDAQPAVLDQLRRRRRGCRA